MTVINLPDEVHRALRVRAATHDHSAEAEVCVILEETVKPEDRIKLGSLLADIGRHAGLQDEDLEVFEREKVPAKPVSLE